MLARRTLIACWFVGAAAVVASSAGESPRHLTGKDLTGLLSHGPVLQQLLRNLPRGIGDTAAAVVRDGSAGAKPTLAVAGGVLDLLTWYRSFEPLGDADRRSDGRQAGLPSAPAACAADGCARCPGDPHARLRAARARLDRNKRIFDDYVDFYQKGVAAGDSIAGAHGLAGLVWLDHKRDIERSRDQVRSAYDTGYRANLEKAQQALIDIGKCEAMLYDSRDWYNRFGYFHLELLTQHYRRGG